MSNSIYFFYFDPYFSNTASFAYFSCCRLWICYTVTYEVHSSNKGEYIKKAESIVCHYIFVWVIHLKNNTVKQLLCQWSFQWKVLINILINWESKKQGIQLRCGAYNKSKQHFSVSNFFKFQWISLSNLYPIKFFKFKDIFRV